MYSCAYTRVYTHMYMFVCLLDSFPIVYMQLVLVDTDEGQMLCTLRIELPPIEPIKLHSTKILQLIAIILALLAGVCVFVCVYVCSVYVKACMACL